MNYLTREQILRIAEAWDYKLGRTQKENAISIKKLADEICDNGQSVSLYYCTKLFKIFGKCHPGFQYRTTKAFLDSLSDEDISRGSFPDFDATEFHNRAKAVTTKNTAAVGNLALSSDSDTPYIKAVRAENNRQFARDIGCIALVLVVAVAFAVHIFNNGWSFDDRSSEERALDQACTSRGQSGCSDAARDLQREN